MTGCTPKETTDSTPPGGAPPGAAAQRSGNSGASGAPPSATAGGGAAATGSGGGDATLIAAGQAVFKTHNCGNCHGINGEGGGSGPDLSKVGAEAEHTTEWLIAHIKNPKSHNPNSPMPAFEGKISDKDLLALGAYLASLK